MNMRLLVVVAIFTSGALGGFIFRGFVTKPVTVLPRRPELEADISKLQNENRELRKGLTQETVDRMSAAKERPSGSEKNSAPTPLEEMRVLADLQDRKVIRQSLKFLDGKGKLDDGFSSLFALTPSEKDALQQSIDLARQNLADLARQKSQVTRQRDGTITISLQPFPAEGGKVYDNMMRTFADVLGSERNDYFVKIASEQAEISLGYFGAAEHSYVFGYDMTERPGQPYTVYDKVTQQTPRGGVQSYGNSTRFKSFDDVAAYVGPVVTLLPPDYKRAK